jgi:group I intron endonuclease
MFIIYTLKDPLTNEIRYVGKTVNIKRRLYLHIAEAKTSKTYKAKWINKLLNSGTRPILEILDVIYDNNWDFWEEYWILQMKSWGFNLCNLTNGGDGVKTWSEEMRHNMSKIKKGCKVWNKDIPMTDITKHKISKAKTGTVSGFKNKKHTDEFKKTKSKEMSDYYKENHHPRLGVKHSDESKKLMSENCRVNKLIKKPILQYSTDEIFLKEWESVIDAGSALGIVPSNIRRVCKSNEFYRIIGGFKWKYK